MKKILTYSILALSINAGAQSIQRQVISSIGSVQSDGYVILSSTVGQAILGNIGSTETLSQGFQQNLTAHQDIDLGEGWGMVSAIVRPYARAMEEVNSEVADDLLIVKDINGSVYMPDIGFNGLGDWDYFQGYNYKMNEARTLSIRGSRIIPELNPLNLSFGWNMMAYLRNTPADVIPVIEAIVEAVIIIKDQVGLAYFPEWGYNGIGNFKPGKAYQIKTTSATVLSFESNATEYRLEQNNHSAIAQNTKRFARPVNTGSNHTVLILETAWGEPLGLGDEIAAYDSKGNMVGSIALQNGHNAIAIWGDDEYTQEKEGLADGEVFTFVLYNQVTDKLSELKVSNWERGNNLFAKDGVSVIAGMQQLEVIDQELELFQNIPNPVRDNTEISFYLPEATKAKLSLTNALGQEVFTKSNKDYKKGLHKVSLQRANLASGMYYYSLQTNTKIVTKQLTIID